MMNTISLYDATLQHRVFGGLPSPLIVRFVVGMLLTAFAVLLGQANSRHVNNKSH
jgi:hypothetical protein